MKQNNSKTSEQPTIALIVANTNGETILAETLTDSDEIQEMELAMQNQEENPLRRVLEFRGKQISEDEEFADFVEDLLSQPFLKPDVQEHAVQWFKSRAKIESYQKAEDEASKVIARYAFQVYVTDPARTDFLLAGPRAKVRIRVIQVDPKDMNLAA
jgi:hypothetical protein